MGKRPNSHGQTSTKKSNLIYGLLFATWDFQKLKEPPNLGNHVPELHRIQRRLMGLGGTYGAPHPFILAFLSTEWVGQASATDSRETCGELKPNRKELGQFTTAFFLRCIPHDYFYLKVDKGRVDVFIADDSKKMVSAGEQIYEKSADRPFAKIGISWSRWRNKFIVS